MRCALTGLAEAMGRDDDAHHLILEDALSLVVTGRPRDDHEREQVFFARVDGARARQLRRKFARNLK